METIKIDSLAYKGYGVGRINSKVAFVGYACPGDTLKIEIYDEHKNYAFGRIVEIINPSPKRITPVCKHFGVCGGCDYLHMPYEEELYWKTEVFKAEFNKTFKDFGFKDFENVNLIKGFKTQNYLNYRQKIGLKIAPPLIGFYKKMSHDVCGVEYCHLAKEGVNELLKNVREALCRGNYGDNFLNEISSVTLTDTGLKNITFSLKNRISNRIQNYDSAFKDIIKKTGADNIFVEFKHKKRGKGGNDKEGKKIIKYSEGRTENDENSRGRGIDNYFMLKGKKFAYDLPSFVQINKEQNENIIEKVTAYIKNLNENRGIYFNNALDLFCGYGNITLFLADYVKMITGVEVDPFSVKLGEKNLKLNAVKNIKFVMSNAGDFLEKAGKERINYDLIVLDPPRAGIKGLVPRVAGLNPSSVIYISCDSMTLLRDLKVFACMGYLIEQINLIDMFPRTYHMEHIAFLSKKQ
ncbi:MAG: 23S rRNA (uracil(1939)-C(5))-methyltransferase RlmD [Deltaproteobacteria bacterium]|nr:23S rRNA (uracil(1939)-C(5))-methyltransferase RlmD [Deltaproteobacteria bacterium]